MATRKTQPETIRFSAVLPLPPRLPSGASLRGVVQLLPGVRLEWEVGTTLVAGAYALRGEAVAQDAAKLAVPLSSLIDAWLHAKARDLAVRYGAGLVMRGWTKPGAPSSGPLSRPLSGKSRVLRLPPDSKWPPAKGLLFDPSQWGGGGGAPAEIFREEAPREERHLKLVK